MVHIDSGAASFNHDFADFGFPGCCWSGWTHSNRVDTTTPGFDNQYSAFAGGGAQGSSNYAIAYLGAPVVRLSAPSVVDSVEVSNEANHVEPLRAVLKTAVGRAADGAVDIPADGAVDIPPRTRSDIGARRRARPRSSGEWGDP